MLKPVSDKIDLDKAIYEEIFGDCSHLWQDVGDMGNLRCEKCGRGEIAHSREIVDLAKFSTNIADAFLVVDELERRQYDWDCAKNYDSRFVFDVCKVHPDDELAEEGVVWQSTIGNDNRCRAICLAALEAVRQEMAFYEKTMNSCVEE